MHPKNIAFRPRLTYDANERLQWQELIAHINNNGGIASYLEKIADKNKRHYHKSETKFEPDGSQTISVNSTRIRTVEELIAYHEIDTDLYEVSPAESTYWESGAKLADGTIVTIPLHRLKVRINPRTNEVNIAKLLSDYLHTQPAYLPIAHVGANTGVAAIGDLHVGANVQSLLLTPDYNIEKLLAYLVRCADIINQRQYAEVTVFILGDIIESFTGTNHKNTWQEINLYGIEAVKAAYKLITTWFLERIANLTEVLIVGGNHDRTTESMELDMRGGAANMLAFMLLEKGYAVTYHPLLIEKTIDGLHYIVTHGHYGISKQDAGQMLFKYGKQDMYNIIMQAHKHTREGSRGLKKTGLTFSEYKTIELDDLKYRKLTIAPLITGNFYSQSLGLNSNAGFTLIENSGEGKPNIHDYCF